MRGTYGGVATLSPLQRSTVMDNPSPLAAFTWALRYVTLYHGILLALHACQSTTLTCPGKTAGMELLDALTGPPT